MSERGTVEIVVYDNAKNGGDWLPSNLADAIGWLQTKLTFVTDAYKTEVNIEFLVLEEDCPHICISYFREETDAEMSWRIGREQDRLMRFEVDEKRLFARLQAKYGKS